MSEPTEQAARGGLSAAKDVRIDSQSWGHLEWMVSGALENSDTLTMGKCFIQPGQNNPVHHHPNCDEVLHVISGRIRHRVGDEYVEMAAGDTISIPKGAIHNAANIGDEPCELLICFDTAYREVVGE
ncbi:cupin domain-containing protein [Glaciibacter superstes]|uniref:cupin domain-containing protein n=1 Tax=Glaciibacter superstes TaxID=501023 RepID=UPI0003B4BE18|nr:cupin domain-containing protein [Glaciibacter superstes]